MVDMNLHCDVITFIRYFTNKRCYDKDGSESYIYTIHTRYILINIIATLQQNKVFLTNILPI